MIPFLCLFSKKSLTSLPYDFKVTIFFLMRSPYKTFN